jgi:site-specific recombinase XerD
MLLGMDDPSKWGDRCRLWVFFLCLWGVHPKTDENQVQLPCINRIVTKVAAAARITPAERVLVTPHAFRHSVATQLVRKRDLVTAADLLGHSSLATTRRYSKASAQDLEAAVDTLYETE